MYLVNVYLEIYTNYRARHASNDRVRHASRVKEIGRLISGERDVAILKSFSIPGCC
jgi:hypothetical protein